MMTLRSTTRGQGSQSVGGAPICERIRRVRTRIAWLAAAVGAALAVAWRLPFLHAPLTADEGGYAEVARLWSRSWTLYGSAWVDRPQGLVLTYRGALAAGLGSTAGLRAVAAGIAAATVVVVFLLARRLAGPGAAVAAALLLATLGASPWIESFTLEGELIAALPAAPEPESEEAAKPAPKRGSAKRPKITLDTEPAAAEAHTNGAEKAAALSAPQEV